MIEPSNPIRGDSSPATSMSLLELAKARDERAWERIVELYAPLVSKWCRRRGLGEADALDVGQEVFRSVFANLDAFRRDRAGQSFRAWLRTITENSVADHYRRRSRQENGPGGTDGHDLLQSLPAADSGGSEDALDDASEQKLILRRCLSLVRNEFEPRTWEAFWRVAVEESSPDSVADALGMKRNAVYLSKSRVMHRLIETYGEVIDGLDRIG